MQVTRNLPEAIRSVEKAAALDPTSVNAKLWLTATQIYLDSARPTDATRVARQGIDLLGPSPASIPVRYELARALVAIGQPRDALAELDFALSIRAYAPAERLRAEIRASLGN
jgi:tetratricopeptide (TPR) repeat protein